MVPDIAFGSHTRVVLDVGYEVASFGAYLLSRDVLTLSIAPKDVHENEIQFALERGVPAIAATFATHRLLYPSQAFDIIHCSRCRINWTCDDKEGLTGNAACPWYVSPDIAEAAAVKASLLASSALLRLLSLVLVKVGGSSHVTSAAGNLFQIADPINTHLVFVEPPNQDTNSM